MTGYAARMRPAERREQLLYATRRVVARGGYTALTMEAVAREANVPKPVVYAAFANRDDVMASLLEVEGERVVAEIGAAIESAAHQSSAGDLTERVIVGLGLVLNVVRRHHQRYRLILVGVDGAPPEVRKAIDAGRLTLTARIAAIIGRAPLPTGMDAELLAMMLVGVGEHATVLVLTEPERYSPTVPGRSAGPPLSRRLRLRAAPLRGKRMRVQRLRPSAAPRVQR